MLLSGHSSNAGGRVFEKPMRGRTIDLAMGVAGIGDVWCFAHVSARRSISLLGAPTCIRAKS